MNLSYTFAKNVAELCTDELRQCNDRSVEVADHCTCELGQHSDSREKTTDQCDTAADQLAKSGSVVITEVQDNTDKPFVQNNEQKEVTLSRVKGGASCPPADLVNHEGPVYDRDHVQPRETERSENVDKCAAVQTRAMKQRELKRPRPLKVS